jgi:L-asparaginase II
VAVTDAHGRLLAWSGDPDRPVFVRSCTKPVQAAVSLTAIGLEEGLPDAQVAIACASHDGTPMHLRAVRGLLRRGGLTEADLRTPPDRPLDPAAAARAGAPRPVCHNCSGKHAAMLLACVRRGWATPSYRSPGHPLQRRVLDAVRLLSGEEPHVGVDGCGVPVHGLPLRAVATMYARLATPEAQGDVAAAVTRALAAMRARPELVGGVTRDDTLVTTHVPGVVMKEGAEALDCAVHLPSGTGIAVKVADGGYRAAGPAIVAVLDQLGLVPASARRPLAGVGRPAVRGGGRPVGHVEAVVALRSRRRP